MRNHAKHSNLSSAAIQEAKLLSELGLKRCTSCSNVKELSEFDTAQKGVGGVSARCKSCRADSDKRYIEENKQDLMFRLTKAILRRQRYDTHVCWLVDKFAHQAAAYLLGPHGLMSTEDAHTFGSVFMNNLPEKLHKLEERNKQRALARQARKLATEKRAVERQEAKASEKLSKKMGRPLDGAELTGKELDMLLYLRMQHHLKNKRRKLKVTDYSFTKTNFTSITGYTITDLREHLAKHMPTGKSWRDVVSGDLHIEHVIPSAAFNLQTLSGVRNCYALSNLTLLDGLANSVKGVTRDKDAIRHFKDDIESARLFGLVE